MDFHEDDYDDDLSPEDLWRIPAYEYADNAKVSAEERAIHKVRLELMTRDHSPSKALGYVELGELLHRVSVILMGNKHPMDEERNAIKAEWRNIDKKLKALPRGAKMLRHLEEWHPEDVP